jgi:NAD(P)-dependent dehydrogenase (short-subunit alcohol dehydrogenase family)
VADELAGSNVDIATYVADIRDQKACRAAVGAAIRQFERMDVLVNAASEYPRWPALEISAGDW